MASFLTSIPGENKDCLQFYLHCILLMYCIIFILLYIHVIVFYIIYCIILHHYIVSYCIITSLYCGEAPNMPA